MMHELKKIVQYYLQNQQKGQRTVLASVVALEGSSYRKPGVRMLLVEDGTSIGAVSGGCVEKEIFKQAASVFKSGIAKVMTYDGRYRLGCEGVLYILIEPFQPNELFLETFQKAIAKRIPFLIRSYYKKTHDEAIGYGSIFNFEESMLPLRSDFSVGEAMQVFEQILKPCFKLIVIGAEHDAVELCSYASKTGWEVTIIAHPTEKKSIVDFKGANAFINAEPETLAIAVDEQVAIVVMTHSYAKDLQFLMRLRNYKPAYFGLLGPMRRREKLFNELLERNLDITEEFLESIHGPAGLDIGAETPQEISISIISEILAVVNKRKPILLKEREGRIHSNEV